ncbi:hypothetical protein Tco_1492380 [Tanacetum coccineum]
MENKLMAKSFYVDMVPKNLLMKMEAESDHPVICLEYRVLIPENNLEDLHSSRGEDGTSETMDSQDLLGCDPLALVDGFTPVEDNTGLLETRVIATNLLLELLMLGQD